MPEVSTKKKRPKRERENPEFNAFARRMLRAYGKRIAIGDIEGLKALAELKQEVQRAEEAAVKGLREMNYSWYDIGRALGISRQAAQKRFKAVK